VAAVNLAVVTAGVAKVVGWAVEMEVVALAAMAEGG
jgi:hypothetical protein